MSEPCANNPAPRGGGDPPLPPSVPSTPHEGESGAELPPDRIGAAGWTVFTPQRQAVFLEQLTATGEARPAARAAGVSPQTAYRARARSPLFAIAWDAACLAARPVAEGVLASRAVDGVEEAVFYRGEEIARRRRYDSRLLLAHLARLDKLAERAELGPVVPLLDEVIENLRAGCELDSMLAEPAAPEEPPPAPGKTSLDRVPGVPSSSADGPPVAPCELCGGRCNDPFARLGLENCQWIGNRRERMEAARPKEAPRPDALAADIHEADAIEAVQLAAFEHGLDGWWELTTPEAFKAALAAREAGDSAAAPGEEAPDARAASG